MDQLKIQLHLSIKLQSISINLPRLHLNQTKMKLTLEQDLLYS